MKTVEHPGASPQTAPASPQGHPRGLYTLFFTEMWERFSYYGMRGLLVLFMSNAVQKGGMGMTDEVANSIYGLYTAMVYLASLPGGWIADRLLGAQRTVWYGGIIIAAGHFTMAIPRSDTFFLGLVLVVIGTGLLKPNISAVVGGLYPEGGTRRDAGFSIFYMGINLGAFLGPLVCSSLGENPKFGWHWGFAAAGFGMVLGLIQYHFSRKHLGEAGLRPGHTEPLGFGGRLVLFGVLAALVLAIGLCLAGVLHPEPVALAQFAKKFILAVAVLYFAGIFLFCKLDSIERKRVVLIVILFVGAALFWAGFEQAGSFFNLFAERHTNRTTGWLVSLSGSATGEYPAGWFQSIGPIFVITLSPVAGAVWIWLARRHLDPSIPIKFGLGLLFLAIGFAVMAGASILVAGGKQVGPSWLIMTYLVHTFGELCLSPVGLSSVTKLAPKRLVGQLMGTWFVASSFGNLLAGLFAKDFKEDALQDWPWLCTKMIIAGGVAGLLLIVCFKPIKKLMAGVR